MSYNEPKKEPLPKYFVLAIMPVLCSIAGMPGAFMTDEIRESLPDIVRVMIFICSCIVYLGAVFGILALKDMKDSTEKKYKGLTLLCTAFDIFGGTAFAIYSLFLAK